jgi:hypothetical protein
VYIFVFISRSTIAVPALASIKAVYSFSICNWQDMTIADLASIYANMQQQSYANVKSLTGHKSTLILDI